MAAGSLKEHFEMFENLSFGEEWVGRMQVLVSLKSDCLEKEVFGKSEKN